MVTLASIRDIKPTEFDEVWAIIRVFQPTKYISWVPELAPSWSLFKEYRSLVSKNNWNENTFQSVYRPIFIHQFRESIQSINKLNELVEKHNAGKNIALVCFCREKELCHRSIIGEFLDELNVPYTLI